MPALVPLAGNQLELFGTKGKLTMKSVEDGELVWTNGGGETQRFDLPKHENMNVPMIEHFIEYIRGDSGFWSAGEDGIVASRVTDAAYRSAAEGRHISV